MFILVSQEKWVYTGRADAGWISDDKELAFEYPTKDAAEHKADMINKYTQLHKHRFLIEEKE